MENKVTTYAVVALVVGILLGVAVGYAAFHKEVKDDNNNDDTNETYWFYIYFGDDAVNTKWYSGTGPDSSEAFDAAMEKAGLDYTIKNGYLSEIAGVEGSWSMYNYLYNEQTKSVAEKSILAPAYDSSGGLIKSNGWVQSAGYDSEKGDLKTWELDSNVFFFSMWSQDASGKWTCPTPVSTTLWIDTTGPFTAA